jgi:hypothetical protein
MKVLDAYEWNEENKDRYPNGSSVNVIMTAYAKYYHEAMIEHYYNWDGINLKEKSPNPNDH